MWKGVKWFLQASFVLFAVSCASWGVFDKSAKDSEYTGKLKKIFLQIDVWTPLESAYVLDKIRGKFGNRKIDSNGVIGLSVEDRFIQNPARAIAFGSENILTLVLIGATAYEVRSTFQGYYFPAWSAINFAVTVKNITFHRMTWTHQVELRKLGGSVMDNSDDDRLVEQIFSGLVRYGLIEWIEAGEHNKSLELTARAYVPTAVAWYIDQLTLSWIGAATQLYVMLK